MFSFWREVSSWMSSCWSSAPGTQAYGKTSRELQFIYIIVEIRTWKRHMEDLRPFHIIAQLS